MNALLVLPVLIPLLTAAVLLLFGKNRGMQRYMGLLGSGALFVTSIILLIVVRQDGIQAIQLGNWPAPYGITLVADLLSAIMVLLAGLMGLTVTVYSLVTMDEERERFSYYPLLQILLMGVCGAFLTGDIFNLYVWFEVMLIASFVLLVLGGERGQLEGAIKYVTLNLVSSAIFLAAIGLLYGLVGTLNMADLSLKLANVDQPGIVTTVSMLFLIAFGIKAAAFPLFFWLPASYHTPPVAISAIFAGLLTKVGVYSLMRVFTLLFVNDINFTHQLILVIAGATMISGALGAVAQSEFRRILSFLLVSQIGFMLMGLGLFTPLALAGVIFYIIHHIIAETNLFLMSGVTHRLGGSYELKRLGGVYKSYPFLGVLFLIPALALAGIPPFSGFFAKFVLVRAGLEIEQYVIVGVALAASVLTLFLMTRLWAEVFWKAAPEKEGEGEGDELVEPESVTEGAARSGMIVLLSPIVVLAVLTILLGVGAEFVYTLASAAADQLLDSTEYIDAVLGGQP